MTKNERQQGYVPTEWKTGDVITAESLNKLEQGVANGQAVPPGEPNESGQESIIVSTVEFSAIKEGLSISYDAVKSEAIVSNGLVTTAEIFVNNLKIAASNVDGIGNEFQVNVSLSLPSELDISPDMSIAVCDTGGAIYAGKFLTFKVTTSKLIISPTKDFKKVLKVTLGFYSSGDYPETFATSNFRDIRIKFI